VTAVGAAGTEGGRVADAEELAAVLKGRDLWAARVARAAAPEMKKVGRTEKLAVRAPAVERAAAGRATAAGQVVGPAMAVGPGAALAGRAGGEAAEDSPEDTMALEGLEVEKEERRVALVGVTVAMPGTAHRPCNRPRRRSRLPTHHFRRLFDTSRSQASRRHQACILCVSCECSRRTRTKTAPSNSCS